MVSGGGDNAEEKPTGNVAHIVGDEGESRLSRGDYFQDDSVEYMRTIRKSKLKKSLGFKHYQTEPKSPRGKVQHPFLGLELRKLGHIQGCPPNKGHGCGGEDEDDRKDDNPPPRDHLLIN
ncbi:hypothetical protein Acr_11g0016070 [Actinidia rufa]|uniref:Uncharacterized protein n=1 Tax=Actinidia rufa TaxID=165716 RepID=A0A7J0FF29_9ERIC|nr:hypothetical protein Acr_11g0016070 [Actinidia rufa]